MYSLIVFLPLFSSVVTGFFGYRLGFKGVVFITGLSLLLSVGLSYYCLYSVGFLLKPLYLNLFS